MSIAAGHVRINLMKKTYEYRITEKDSEKTIESYLRSLGYSRKVLTHLRRTDGGILLDGTAACTTGKLYAGSRLSVCLAEAAPSEHIVPVRMPLDIVYEDDELMVVNKAAGVPIHPSQGNFDNTLANGIAFYFREKHEEFVYRAVNRLDRDTTGLLIIAKNMLSASILYAMAAKKEIRREYLAVVSGAAPAQGTVCAPIARKAGSTIERCVDEENGEYACTHYRRLSYDGGRDCSLLLITLDTGRTHQIRVHMKHIGHPLPGDFLYNPDYRFTGRQLLHSYRLSLLHPITKEPLEFTAPPPEDFHFLRPLG